MRTYEDKMPIVYDKSVSTSRRNMDPPPRQQPVRAARRPDEAQPRHVLKPFNVQSKQTEEERIEQYNVNIRDLKSFK